MNPRPDWIDYERARMLAKQHELADWERNQAAYARSNEYRELRLAPARQLDVNVTGSQSVIIDAFSNTETGRAYDAAHTPSDLMVDRAYHMADDLGDDELAKAARVLYGKPAPRSAWTDGTVMFWAGVGCVAFTLGALIGKSWMNFWLVTEKLIGQ